MTTSTSRGGWGPVTAATASRWPGRNAGKPKTSRSAPSGSPARANGRGGSGPRPGSDGATSGSVTSGADIGRTTIARGPVANRPPGGAVTELARRRRGPVTEPCTSAARHHPRHDRPRPTGRRPRARGGDVRRPHPPLRRADRARAPAPAGRRPDGVDGRALRPRAALRRPRRRLPLHRRRRQRLPRLQPGRPQRHLRLRAARRAGRDRGARGPRAAVPAPRRGGDRGGGAARRAATGCRPGSSRSRPPARTPRRSGSPATAPAASWSSSSRATTTGTSTTCS